MWKHLFNTSLVAANFLAAGAHANIEFGGNISYGFNDNISNAVSSRDIFEDSFIAANVNIGRLWVPAVGKSLLLSGHLGTELYNDSTGLDRYSYGVSLAYIHKLGLGAYTPRIFASVRADYRDFDTDMRDGILYRASLGLEKRFTPELHGSITLTREQRTADASKAVPYMPNFSGDVFNQSNSELVASMDYTLPNESLLTARYLYRNGEIDASTNPGSAFFGFTNTIAMDKRICKTCRNYVVYQTEASIHSLLLDWNFALGRDTSVSASVERRVGDATGGVTYTGNLWRVQLNQRF